MEFLKLSLPFAVLWDAHGLQLFLPFHSCVPPMLSSLNVNYPRQMLAVRKSDNSIAGAQEPWAEQQEPLSLFILFWNVTEHDQILLLPILLLPSLARRIWM